MRRKCAFQLCIFLQVPKPKAMTKWEKYAKVKGIQNKKKSRMIWDEPSQVPMANVFCNETV